MELVYKGFDGLDVSFKGQISPSFSEALDRAKATAQIYHRDEYLDWRGIGILVKESGARGGYAFTVRTGEPDATWFFKKPNANDPWGVRTSCNSLQLALHGLGRTRADILQLLSAWEIAVPDGGESIGRVDYAMDFFAPDFILQPDSFVMHSNSNRADQIGDVDMKVQGKSGRVTSVTVGQMPGRQVIIYDKRLEVIAKRKLWWRSIWDANRNRRGEKALEHEDPITSRVWRVELRAGKRHLKNDWGIRTWQDLDRSLGDVFAQMLAVIRYTTTSNDTNRSRWPNHQLWDQVNTIIQDDLFELMNFAPPDLVRQVHREAYDGLLARQMVGLLISRAALRNKPVGELDTFAKLAGEEMASQIQRALRDVEKRLQKASNRLRVLT